MFGSTAVGLNIKSQTYMKNYLTLDLEKFFRINNNFDYSDAAIFDFIYHMCASMHSNIQEKRIEDDGITWTWVDYTTIMDQLPLLHINSKFAITKRIQKLQENKLLQTRREGNQKIYISMTAKATNIYMNADRYGRES